MSLFYGGDFVTYITEFLIGIDAETDNRFNMLMNKNAKYLFYRYNDFLLSKNRQTISIRHSKIVEDYVAPVAIQNKKWQYLIESLISRVEDDNQEFRLKTVTELSLLKKNGKKM